MINVVFEGTLIYTDSWKGYGDLKNLGYKHKERILFIACYYQHLFLKNYFLIIT